MAASLFDTSLVTLPITSKAGNHLVTTTSRFLLKRPISLNRVRFDHEYDSPSAQHWCNDYNAHGSMGSCFEWRQRHSQWRHTLCIIMSKPMPKGSETHSIDRKASYAGYDG
ncbi:hypothetical protein AMTR_s00031p00219520 [Amborella trichopoda]|uniref:Uncharacterized protein n=1 Tax=Amborella trichopoda TaxID=13333 RepID=U5D2E7_AMBTC|nr:hypothetical protein AMTR_s00031p00219520 [Amborella trichopoda]